MFLTFTRLNAYVMWLAALCVLRWIFMSQHVQIEENPYIVYASVW